jgi:hypothetical protein
MTFIWLVFGMESDFLNMIIVTGNGTHGRKSVPSHTNGIGP